MIELIINKEENKETICLVENGKLIEKYQNDENTKKNRLEGNIYAGKVADIAAWHRDLLTDPDALFECDFVMKEGVQYPTGNLVVD